MLNQQRVDFESQLIVEEFPKCDQCNSNEHVKDLGPATFGSEFHCINCYISWVQET